MGRSRSSSLLPDLPGIVTGLFPALRRATGSPTSIAGVVSDIEGVERFRWILHNTVRGNMLMHVLYLALFVWLGVTPLIVVNVASLLAYALTLVALRRGHSHLPFVVTALVSIGHAFAASAVLGLVAGFFIHIPYVTALAFLQPHVSRLRRSLWGALTLVAFIGVLVLGELTSSLVHLPALTNAALAIFNATAFLMSIGFLTYVAQEAARNAERDLRIALARLDELARTDPLTGLLNRRAMTDQIEAEVKRVARTSRPFALLVVDLDDFKAINDLHGHAIGDHTLCRVAERLQAALRAQDRVARWGGEEFLVLLPETDHALAQHVAERLRSAVANPPLTVDDVPVRTTATFGVTVYQPGDTIHETVRSADRALYEGKVLGKDRVILSPQE